MNEDELTGWLDAQWEQSLASFDGSVDEEIDQFINSTVVSIRYAVLTQLLGKHADQSRDLLCLQRGTTGPRSTPVGRWSPRSFCTRVVVPWVQRHQNVLGTSADPYVSKPLRRARMDAEMGSLKNREEWEALVGFLGGLESQADPDLVQEKILGCLKSIVRRLGDQQVQYPVPMRVSIDHLCNILDRYLAIAGGGLRPLVISTALMRTLGEAFSLFSRVESQGVTEADSASGAPGDVMCYGLDGYLVLAVEAKGHSLSMVELDTTITKARTSRVANILFATPGISTSDSSAIGAKIAEEFGQGTNIYQSAIVDIVRSSFMLLGEEWRVEFLQAIGSELDARSSQPSDRLAFARLLSV